VRFPAEFTRSAVGVGAVLRAVVGFLVDLSDITQLAMKREDGRTTYDASCRIDLNS
jgi:hypothetical protein